MATIDPDFVLIDPLTGTEVFFVIATDEGSPGTDWGQSGSSGQVTYKVLNENRHAGKRALLGRTAYQGAPGPHFTRSLPHSMLLDDGAWLYASRVSIKQRGQRARVDVGPSYELAYLTTTYEPLPYNVAHDNEIPPNTTTGAPDESYLVRWVSHTSEGKTNNKTVPGGALYFTIDDLGTMPNLTRPVFQGHTIPLNETLEVFTWHQVPEGWFPKSTVLASLNHSNITAWSTRFGDYAADTLLLASYKTEKTRMPDGTYGLNAIYFMRYFAAGWNTLPDPEYGNQFLPVVGYDAVTPAVYAMIPQAEFRDLFRPAAASNPYVPAGP